MQKIQQVVGRGVPLLLDDIDTDRIIPARYLRCVTFDGLGEHVFEDDRKQQANHPFDDPRYQGATILIAGRNFGCGSSREHAPQALQRWGIKAIVGESYAEIFFGNCTTNGIPCVCAAPADLVKLKEAIEANPQQTVTVDLEAGKVTVGNVSVPVTLQESAKKSLTSGNWDFLAQLVEAESEIHATAARLPYMSNFA